MQRLPKSQFIISWDLTALKFLIADLNIFCNFLPDGQICWTSYKGLFHALSVTLNKKTWQEILMLKISFIIGWKLIPDVSPRRAQELLIKNIIKVRMSSLFCTVEYDDKLKSCSNRSDLGRPTAKSNSEG